MAIIELVADEFCDDGKCVKIGSVASAIAKRFLADGSPNKFQAEHDAWPLIHTGIVAGKLHPLDQVNRQLLSADNSGDGIVQFDELVEWGKWCKRFDFVRQTAGPAPEEWEAALDVAFEQLEKMKRNHGRYTLEEAAAFIQERIGEDAEEVKRKLIAAVKRGELPTYGPGSFLKRDSEKKVRDFYEHARWNELNEWLKKNEPHLYQNCKFPDPAAPAAKREAAPVATPATAGNKLRRNNLDPAIDKAIKQAGTMELANVYLRLRELAKDEEPPFTGVFDGDALCYTDDNNNLAKLTNAALRERLKRHVKKR